MTAIASNTVDLLHELAEETASRASVGSEWDPLGRFDVYAPPRHQPSAVIRDLEEHSAAESRKVRFGTRPEGQLESRGDYPEIHVANHGNGNLLIKSKHDNLDGVSTDTGTRSRQNKAFNGSAARPRVSDESRRLENAQAVISDLKTLLNRAQKCQDAFKQRLEKVLESHSGTSLGSAERTSEFRDVANELLDLLQLRKVARGGSKARFGITKTDYGKYYIRDSVPGKGNKPNGSSAECVPPDITLTKM